MKYVILLSLVLVGCTDIDLFGFKQINKDLDQAIKTNDRTIAMLECMSEMMKTDFEHLIPLECRKTLECTRAYIDKWDEDCIARKLEK